MKLKIKKLSLLIATIVAPALLLTAPIIVTYSGTSQAATIGNTCETGYAPACLRDSKVNPIMSKIIMIIRFLAAVVGVIAVIMMIVGGIQYTVANGNPQSVADAKKKITNVLIGVLAFVFLWAFLEWIIPGGIWQQATP